MLILNVPIEPIEERYSVQWDRWFLEFFQNQSNIDVQTIYGGTTSGKINNGSFLDVIETNVYKTSQLHKILRILSGYDNSDKLVIFFHDLWFPGLEAIAYVRDGMRFTNLKICGCLHAGSYDPFDFLEKTGMTRWARHIEEGWLANIADRIFVATDYHKGLICSTRNVPSEKVVRTGFPIFPEFVQSMKKKKLVVFPHRLDSEKCPYFFDKLRTHLISKYPEWCFVKTKEVTQNKMDYYRILNESSIAISFAKQETWGIAMQEAVLCGAVPICPDRLSYREMYEKQYIYNSIEEAFQKTEQYIQLINKGHTINLNQQRNTFMESGSKAIPKITMEIINNV